MIDNTQLSQAQVNLFIMTWFMDDNGRNVPMFMVLVATGDCNKLSTLQMTLAKEVCAIYVPVWRSLPFFFQYS